LVDLPLEAKFLSHVNLAELKEAIPLDSLELKGMLALDLEVKGNYAPKKKRFPLAIVTLTLNDGAVQTKYYPCPIENIHLAATIVNKTGKLSGTTVRLDPLSFTFEGNPLSSEAVYPIRKTFSMIWYPRVPSTWPESIISSHGKAWTWPDILQPI